MVSNKQHQENIILEMDAQVVIQDLLNEDFDLSVEGVLIVEVKTFFLFFQLS